MNSRTIFSSFEEALFRQHQQESHHRFTLELGLFIALLFGSFMLEINNLHYNTLFLDEAINAVVGEDVLHGVFTRNAIAFHYGSYSYPVVSGILNWIGGVLALRFASTILICLASAFVYFTARKLFGYKASLFSMMLFAFSGVILNLAQLAVSDALALPLLCLSLYFLVSAPKSEYSQKSLLFAASACVTLSILAKYIGVIYLPALFLTALVLFRARGIPLRQALRALTKYFVLPMLFILNPYAAYYSQELVQVYRTQGFSAAPRSSILPIISQEIGIFLILALIGLVFLVMALREDRQPGIPSLFWNQESRLHWNTWSRFSRILFCGFLVLLVVAWLAAPLQQLLSGNIRSLWKNCAYSLVFLAPLAGYGMAALVESLRQYRLAGNLIGILLLCSVIIYFSNQSLDSTLSFHQSWPNTSGVISYLKSAGLDQNSRVLAEGMDIYEYYFDFGTNDRQVWNSFWYMEYGGKSGQEGALAAVHDRVPDFIIIDNYYSPGIRKQLEPLLAEAGYTVGWQEKQKLRSGTTILLQVFIPNEQVAK